MSQTIVSVLMFLAAVAGLAAAGARDQILTEIAAWETTRQRVERLMLEPDPAWIAVAADVVTALRAEAAAHEQLPAGATVHLVRPFNDLAAETAYADRMVEILRPQQVPDIAELYAARATPGWYDRATLAAKFDLHIRRARQQSAGNAAALVAAHEAGKVTYTAMRRFNALMTRESPLVQPTRELGGADPVTAWEIGRLSAPPAVRWLDQTNAVRSLLYRGEPYQGKPSDVFAYYATPGTLEGDPSRDNDLPALVLVHGGGDRAFRDWVAFWAGKGYAAIAMDLAGQGPTLDGVYDKLFKPERLLRGGPGQDGKRKFLDIDLPLTDQWPYQAVANVILAHSLIRSLSGVDPNRTAVAGISWGGYLTCIAAGVDHRFKAAMPFYGCGFLAENSVWKDMGLFDELGADRAQRWTRLWDPARYAGQIRCPVFAVTGAKDFAYPLESFAKTYALPKGHVQFRITPEMGHGAQFLTATAEAVIFMDSVLRGGTPLPLLRDPKIADNVATTHIAGGTIIRAQLHYTMAGGPNKTREWTTIDATIADGLVSAPWPTVPVAIAYFTATTPERVTVSSRPFWAAGKP